MNFKKIILYVLTLGLAVRKPLDSKEKENSFYIK